MQRACQGRVRCNVHQAVNNMKYFEGEGGVSGLLDVLDTDYCWGRSHGVW